jgi:uncharacterized membrane protein
MKPRQRIYLAYLSVIIALGAAAVASSVYRLLLDWVSYQWLILAYLTVLTGAFTIAIPGVNSKFSVSDTFIFLNTILFGTAAGVLTAALDGLVGSLRGRTTARRTQIVPFNTAVLALSAYAAGEVFFKMSGQGPLTHGSPVALSRLALPAILAALAYYLCNSTFVAGMLALDSGGKAIRLWRTGLFRTLGITLAGAGAGALMAFGVRSITPLTLLVIVPILVSIYFLNMIYLGPETKPGAAADAKTSSIAQRPTYRRFHYFMVALGLGFVALLLNDIIQENLSDQWMIVASLAVLAGFVTVKIPGVKIKFSLADTFVFANTILFGPVVGGITAALDGLAGSVRCKSKTRRLEFTLFNMAGMALSAYIAGELFFRILGYGPMDRPQTTISAETFLPALVLAISYYLLNTMAVAVIVALQAHENVLRVWRENLLWGLTTCVACALGAVFVAAGMVAITPTIMIAVSLTLAVIYTTFRTYADRVTQKIQPSA